VETEHQRSQPPTQADANWAMVRQRPRPLLATPSTSVHTPSMPPHIPPLYRLFHTPAAASTYAEALDRIKSTIVTRGKAAFDRQPAPLHLRRCSNRAFKDGSTSSVICDDAPTLLEGTAPRREDVSKPNSSITESTNSSV